MGNCRLLSYHLYLHSPWVGGGICRYCTLHFVHQGRVTFLFLVCFSFWEKEKPSHPVLLFHSVTSHLTCLPLAFSLLLDQFVCFVCFVFAFCDQFSLSATSSHIYTLCFFSSFSLFSAHFACTPLSGSLCCLCLMRTAYVTLSFSPLLTSLLNRQVREQMINGLCVCVCDDLKQ